MDIDQLREEIAFQAIIEDMLKDERVMTEVVTAMHVEMPMAEHGKVLRAALTGAPQDRCAAKQVIEAAIVHAAKSRADRVKIISAMEGR